MGQCQRCWCMFPKFASTVYRASEDQRWHFVHNKKMYLHLYAQFASCVILVGGGLPLGKPVANKFKWIATAAEKKSVQRVTTKRWKTKNWCRQLWYSKCLGKGIIDTYVNVMISSYSHLAIVTNDHESHIWQESFTSTTPNPRPADRMNYVLWHV